MSDWMDRVEKALKFGEMLAKLLSELMDAVRARDAKRVDEILDGDLQTTVALKASRAQMLRELQERDVE